MKKHTSENSFDNNADLIVELRLAPVKISLAQALLGRRLQVEMN